MHFAINTFLFTSPFTNESVKLFPLFKSWGFDGVEIAIEDPSHIDPLYIIDELDKSELKCSSICAAMGPDRDFRGTQLQQETSMTYLKAILDQMEVLKCPILAGPIYSSVGRAEAVEPEDYKNQWSLVTKNLKELSAYTQNKGLLLSLEPLNRFETDFINTCQQGLNMIGDVDNPSLGIHLDTFHMNIEEKDLSKAIIQAGDKLTHFHACGSDRGTPGSEHILWEPIVKALKAIHYNRGIAIESFTKDVKVIAKAAAIWRQIESSQEEIASKGLTFLKKVFN